MQGVNFRRLFLVAGSAALIIVYAFLWARMISSPEQRTGSDFIALYAAGRVAREAGFSQVYNNDLQQGVQERVVGFSLAPGQVLLYNHVPFLVPLLSLLSGDDYVVSFILWVLILASIFLVSITILTSLLHRENWKKPDIRSAWIGFLLFFPSFISLINGQDTSFTTLGLCLWVYGLLTGKYWLAGIGLAFTTVRPHITFILALPFLFRLRRVFAWFCVGAVFLALASLLIVGVEGTRGFLDLLFVSAGGDVYGLQETAMVNLVGLLSRLFPGAETGFIHWIGWGAYAAAIITLCILWLKIHTLNERHFSFAVIMSLFFAPHLHYHDLALLLVPITCLMLYAVRMHPQLAKTIPLLPLAISLLLLLGSLVPGLKFNLPLLVMVFLAILPWLLTRLFPPAGLSNKIQE